MTEPSAARHQSFRSLWRQFLPLSVSDVTMAAGDPMITTTLAHLPLATANLAAIGVAKAIAVFFESPIIMVLHASNALSPAAASRAALRRFVMLACGTLTALLAILTLPSVFSAFSERFLGVSDDLAPLAREALLFLLLWPAAIGWRRYYQGLLIRQGHAKAVANAGIVRLIVVAVLLAIGYRLSWHGVRLAGAALIGGVLSEAIAVTLAAKSYGVSKPPQVEHDPRLPSNIRGVWRFYWPLANSMLVVWGGRALLIAVVARAVDAPIALAAWPAAWGLTLVIANATRMVQQVIIKNYDGTSYGHLLRFAASVGLAFSLILLLIGASDAGQRVIDAFVGRNAGLAAGVQPVILVCAIVPLLIAVQNGVQGLLIAGGQTGRINIATWLGTACLLSTAFLGIRAELPGATAAAVSMVVAIAAETTWLALGLRRPAALSVKATLPLRSPRSLREKVGI